MIRPYYRHLPLFLGFLLISISPISIAFDKDEEARLIEKLNRISSRDMLIEKVEPSEAEGVYIVTMGSNEYYVFSHGDYILVGDLYDTVRQVDVGQERSNKRIAEAISAVSEDNMIMMGEPLEKYVTVFTDTDCFYCQKFHLEVEALQNEGIQVRYLMFPRSGIGTESYIEAVSVWCSDDQADAMTVAKAGGTVKQVQCENPVADQYEFGQSIGIRGTPTIILQNGKVINGYAPPDVLVAESG
ncbi:MAG: DsbC family protein [Gammaproteobacteria bacterium]|nr:DsbC family protein [Gammaproteobacteria bacterium]MCY4219131.1 DsbC family protein [Gammaproteobacteria bacterium]MCY4275032.1 DsbC family protein [Gammaproteobacteria bacterium]